MLVFYLNSVMVKLKGGSRMKKRLMLLSAVVACIPVSASALTSIDISGWRDGYQTWAPDVTEMKVDNDTKGEFRAISYIEFDSSSVNEAIDIPSDLYFTMEHLNKKDNSSSYSNDLYTNIPYAYYDIEDDNENGMEEELEVTCYCPKDPTPFTANKTYYFDTTHHNFDRVSVNMDIDVRAQRSMRAAFTGEMQAHSTNFYGATGAYAVSSSTSRKISETDSIESTNNKILLAPEATTNKELQDEMLQQNLMVKALVEEATTEDNVKSLLRESEVVVTFEKPLTSKELEEVLRNTNAELNMCTIAYTDSTGERVTGWTEDYSESNLAAKLEHLKKMDKDTEMEGIVSANIIVDLTETNLADINACQNVFLADASDTLIRVENKDYDKELDIIVCDMSWDLERF